LLTGSQGVHPYQKRALCQTWADFCATPARAWSARMAMEYVTRLAAAQKKNRDPKERARLQAPHPCLLLTATPPCRAQLPH